MYISIVGYKGGIGKTTTAVHLATFLNQRAPTLLVDGDPNRSATTWARHNKLPIKVVDELMAARYARDYDHMVFDTKARPNEDDLQALATGCDLLIVPSTPDALSMSALMLTIDALRTINVTNYVVLVTIVPPKPNRDGDAAIRALQAADVPVFPFYIRRYVAFQRAAMQGVAVSDVDDANAQAAWQDYVAVGKEILGEQ